MFSSLQHSSNAGNLHQYIHHPRQHPLHLCHILLHQGSGSQLDAKALIVCCFYFVQSKNLICSFLQLFPGAMQTVSKKIVQSRTNSTLVGVFSIILVFISAFINMVRFCKSNKETEFCSRSDSLVVCGRLAAVCLRHHKLVGMCRREAEHLHGPGDAMSDLQLECVRRRGSRDLSKPRSFLPVS